MCKILPSGRRVLGSIGLAGAAVTAIFGGLGWLRRRPEPKRSARSSAAAFIPGPLTPASYDIPTMPLPIIGRVPMRQLAMATAPASVTDLDRPTVEARREPEKDKRIFWEVFESMMTTMLEPRDDDPEPPLDDRIGNDADDDPIGPCER